jgi:prepilin-type N-terminal cleavage/methylation domain-containing protein
MERHRKSRPRAFTLIELLVVIAIIAILAAILFPVFAKAREKSIETKCISQLKQLGTALIMYAQDSDGRLPYAWHGYNLDVPVQQQFSLVAALNPYIKQPVTASNIRDSVWYCTALPPALTRYPPGASRAYAYIYRSYFAEGTPGVPLPSRGEKPTTPSLMAVPIDGPYTFGEFTQVHSGQNFYSDFRRSPSGMPVIWDQRDYTRGDAATLARGGEFPHNNRAEILCLDGHVRGLTEKDRNDPRKSPWRVGSDFSG